MMNPVAVARSKRVMPDLPVLICLFETRRILRSLGSPPAPLWVNRANQCYVINDHLELHLKLDLRVPPPLLVPTRS